MNYRHAFHAGNHADVLKHAVLARVLDHLRKKDKPFRVIDAHAGIGVYDLGGVEAHKTGEWQTGIGKMGEPFGEEADALLASYRACLAGLNPQGGLRYYPGSPDIAARLMRAGDRMIANELHPDDHAALAAHFGSDRRIKVTALDAEACVKANLPPPERRGLILIDPPYEEKAEAQRALRMLAQGLRRFASGTFLLWYPLKADDIASVIADGAVTLGVAGTLRVELRVREAFKGGGLAGSGLLIVNPPWRLDAELHILVPALAARLGLGGWGQARVDWLVPPA
ncbi:MAG: 23S rRNA (adenine(2030)-N(6))-methyltransferase RlmJ [Alphaproteobacteria bacterium]|nr:23S rRNA (adenine(2030)-N(6))-methyltransferase RlmJ [Alphaproteobacteria bacterium]